MKTCALRASIRPPGLGPARTDGDGRFALLLRGEVVQWVRLRDAFSPRINLPTREEIRAGESELTIQRCFFTPEVHISCASVLVSFNTRTQIERDERDGKGRQVNRRRFWFATLHC